MALDRDEQTDSVVIPGSGKDTPLQITRWSGQRVSVTTTVASQALVLPVGSKVIEITAEGDVFIAFGDTPPTASSTIASDGSRLLLAGVQVIPVPLNPATGNEYTDIAVIWVTAAGIFQIEQVS